jgi:hypothetical protein
MTADEQLLYESRVKMRQALIAAVAGILLVTAAAMQLAGPQSKVNELTLGLITEHKRFPLDVIGAVVNGLGLIAVAWTLSFLFEITRARNEGLRPFIRILAIAGGVLGAITAIAYAILVADKASQFVSNGLQTYPEAHHLTNGAGFLAVPLIGQLGALLLAVGFVLTSLNAMRVGLLTRFMGYLGVFTGVLVLFPIGSPVPIVQGFWLLALAYLMSGRWPSGLPPAWQTGKAERWPSSQELREKRLAARESAGAGRGGGGGGFGFGRPKPAPAKPAPPAKPAAKPARNGQAEPVAAEPAARTRSTTPKRKRKKRR